MLSKSSSAISSLDWSEDSSYIQTNDLGYELLFYSIDEDDLSKSKQVTSATAMRDVQWNTHTCKLGWPVQGVFDPSQGGQDINSVDVTPSKSLIATGDDNGDVKIFRSVRGHRAGWPRAWRSCWLRLLLLRFGLF